MRPQDIDGTKLLIILDQSSTCSHHGLSPSSTRYCAYLTSWAANLTFLHIPTTALLEERTTQGQGEILPSTLQRQESQKKAKLKIEQNTSYLHIPVR